MKDAMDHDIDFSRFEWAEPLVNEVPTPTSIKLDRAKRRRFVKGHIPFEWLKECQLAHPLGVIFALCILMRTGKSISDNNHSWIVVGKALGHDAAISRYQRYRLVTAFVLANLAEAQPSTKNRSPRIRLRRWALDAESKESKA